MPEDPHALHQFLSPYNQIITRKEVRMSIEQMMKDGKTDSFLHYQDGELWYRTASGFDFPEPLNSQGAAAFLVQDQAMYFMR